MPDVEWASWYLADSKGFFAQRGVEIELIHGGPNTPAVAQVLAAGTADLGLASEELQLIKANEEGADYVVLGAMYQRSPLGYCWMTASTITTADDLVGKRIGAPEGDQIHIERSSRSTGLDPTDYTFVPMSFDPQPLVDGESTPSSATSPTSPIQLQLQGLDATSAPFSDFGVPSYGDLLFAEKEFVDANRDLVVGVPGRPDPRVEANVANPDERHPAAAERYGKDAEIDDGLLEGRQPGVHRAVGERLHQGQRAAVDRPRLPRAPRCGAASSSRARPACPPVAEFLDATLVADAHKLWTGAVKITAIDPLALGYRKVDPPMARSFAVVRVETDAGIVGWGEASTNWGHSYPTVFAAAVRDVCAGPLLGTDPTDVRGRLAQLHVMLDGYLGWEGLTSQVIAALEIACWDITGQALEPPLHRLLGAANRPLRLYGTGTTMFEETADYHAHYFDEALAHGFGGMKVRLGRSRCPTTSRRSPPCASTSAPTP